MSSNIDNWLRNAPRWREELERALKMHGGNDVVVQYDEVARAFPSSEAHPLFFEKPLIDHKALKQWALVSDWGIHPAPEMAPENSQAYPPVRFIRTA